MGVSARYMLAAAALAFAPTTALADCMTCGGGPASNPTVNIPGPHVGNPHFTGGPSVGGSHGGCGSRCGPGVPDGPTVVVPTPFVPAPHVVITHGGYSHESTTLNITNYIDDRTFSYRGGGGYIGTSTFGVDGGAGLALGAALSRTRTETRVTEQMMAIQAICVDDRGTPHPASQTFGEQDIADDYDGEIFRCIAGTQMRITIGRWENGAANLQQSRTFDCARGEALAYREGAVFCRTQEARRQCNERSLLRRYGPGLKVVRIRVEEQVTTQEEIRTEMQTSAPAAAFDGGVGLSVW